MFECTDTSSLDYGLTVYDYGLLVNCHGHGRGRETIPEQVVLISFISMGEYIIYALTNLT